MAFYGCRSFPFNTVVSKFYDSISLPQKKKSEEYIIDMEKPPPKPWHPLSQNKTFQATGIMAIIPAHIMRSVGGFLESVFWGGLCSFMVFLGLCKRGKCFMRFTHFYSIRITFMHFLQTVCLYRCILCGCFLNVQMIRSIFVT